MAPRKRSMKDEVNKELQKEKNVIDVGLPKELSGMVLYAEEEFKFWVPSEYKEVYKDKSKWPVFKIRTFNAEDESALLQMMLENQVTGKNSAIKFFMSDPRAARIVVKRCLKGVKNLYDAKNKPVELILENDQVPDNFLSRVPFKLLNGLQKEIMGGSDPTPEEVTGLEF